MAINTKECTKCNEEKPLDEYHKKSGSPDGLSYWCKLCKKKSAQKYYQNNKQSIYSKQLEYRENNKEKYRAYQRNWMNDKLKNDDEYYFKNKIRSCTYRALENKSTGDVSKSIIGCDYDVLRAHLESIVDDFNSRDYHIDHVVPLSLANCEFESIQLSHYTNLQPLEEKHNCSKKNKYAYRVNVKRVLKSHPNPHILCYIMQRNNFKLV